LEILSHHANRFSQVAVIREDHSLRKGPAGSMKNEPARKIHIGPLLLESRKLNWYRRIRANWDSPFSDAQEVTWDDLKAWDGS
jgi:hypothetical protein